MRDGWKLRKPHARCTAKAPFNPPRLVRESLRFTHCMHPSGDPSSLISAELIARQIGGTAARCPALPSDFAEVAQVWEALEWRHSVLLRLRTA